VKITGQIILIIGLGLLLWGIYQYFSNQPTPISEPKDITQGIKTLTDMYENVFEKAQKQKQAKDIGAMGVVMMIIGIIIIFTYRNKLRPTLQTKIDGVSNKYCVNCGIELKPNSSFCSSCGGRIQ